MKRIAIVLVLACLVRIVQAEPTLDVSGGQLLGAQNVDVGGTLYDVAFFDGNCVDIFSGCDEVVDFAFSDITTAGIAGEALLNQVFVDGPLGNFDSDHSLTAGCNIFGLGPVCVSFIPYHLPESGLVAGRTALNSANESSDAAGSFQTTTTFDTTTDGAKNWAVFTPSVPVPEPEIDIKPGSDPNCFNINGHGVIPVAVLGGADFHVSQILPDSLTFGGLEVRVRANKGPLCHFEDTNVDGFTDLVCQFQDDPENWSAGQATADLQGTLTDGVTFTASDEICVVP